MTWRTLKTVLWSAVGGAIVWWIVLGAVFGWMSAGSAERQAAMRAQAAFREALTPICVARFREDSDRETKHKALTEVSSWKRGDFVNAQGWATMPGSEHPEVRITEECAKQILALSTL